jgi:ABC-type sugar transport system ATPase subunit
VAMLEIRNVTKRFPVHGSPGQFFAALENVSFEVEEGEFVSLLGPSGCGKTTLIRIVMGLLPAEGGEILVNSSRVTAPGRDPCMVFQNFGLLP